MPFPWAIAAKAIPWTEVISAAPSIARGARDLWKRVRSEREDAASTAATTAASDDPLAAMRREIVRLDADVAAQAELIARLAGQQEQLVATLDRQQGRTRLALTLAVGAIVAMLWLVLRT